MDTTKVTDPVLQRVLALGQAEIPTFDIRYKDTSWFMKALFVVVRIFNPTFMTNYITTVGTTVYFPSEAYFLADQMRAALVISHELVHMRDSKRLGNVPFFLMYFFPQELAVLALLSIGAIWNPWFLLALLALLLLAPLPAPGRKYLELRGYTMSMATAIWIGGAPSYDNILKQFTGSAYYFMWPWMKTEELLKIEGTIESGEILSDPFYASMKKAFTG